MGKTVKIIIILLIILLSTSGCWDSINIEDRDVCTAVTVDKEKGNYTFCVEIPVISSNFQNSRSEQGGQDLKTSIVKGSGKTFAEARDSLDKSLNKPLYLGAVQSLIFTERFADSGIGEYALRLRQMIEYRKTMDVIVTPDKPEDFLGEHPSNQTTVGFAVGATLENISKLGLCNHISLAELLQKLSSASPCFVVNTLSVREGQISLIGNTVFDGDKRIGFIPSKESRGIIFMLRQAKTKPKFDYVVDLGDKAVTVETTLKNKKIIAAYDGRKASFNIKLTFQAMELYPTAPMTLTEDIENQIRHKLTEQIRDEIQETIHKSQKEFECDYLAFSEPFRISFPDAYAKMNWKDEFKKAEFNISVSVKMIPNRAVDYKPASMI